MPRSRPLRWLRHGRTRRPLYCSSPSLTARSGATGTGAIGEAQPLGGARCRTAEGRAVPAPSSQVVRALVGSIVWPSSADPTSRGATLATAAVGIPIRQQWRPSPTGGARPSLPRAVTASPIGGATSSMVDLRAATLPRPVAAVTTPSRDRHPPCQARGGDALPRPRQRWRRPSPSSGTSSPTDGGAGGHHALVDCGQGTGSNSSESPAPEDGDTATTRRRHLGAGPVAAPHPHLRHPNQALPPSVVGGRGARLPRDLPRHRLPLDEGLVQYVLDLPVMLWFVGPMFAALTGLVFKEGLCYGKREAGISTFVIPGLLLGHLVLSVFSFLIKEKGQPTAVLTVPFLLEGLGCDAHKQTSLLLGGLGDIGTGLDALAGDIEALSILTNALVVSQDHTMAFDEMVVGCSVSLCSRLLAVYRIANSDGVSLGLMG